ncbi:hypothetical protein [Leptospira perolatii]|nr:hypothetical protein [Leptospira perolatii]
MQVYQSNPPFLRFDFTDSYLEDRSSQIFHLVDGKLDSTWKKLRNSPQQADFDLELRLTHTLQEKIYVPRKWKAVQVIACSKNAPPLELSLILRESINVDKESRLPKDQIVKRVTLDFRNSEKETIQITENFTNVPQTDYPKGIFIWSVQGSFEQVGPEVCLREIQLVE